MNILVQIPILHDSTSFYRGMGPLGRLANKHQCINLSTIVSWNWATMMSANVVFLQRPYLTEHKQVVERARMMGKPVWVDYDDLLLEVPTSNPTYFNYSTPDIIQNVEFILRESTIVTVSTPFLKNLLGRYNKNIAVVPNAIDFDLYPYWNEKPGPRKKIMAWRGSKTHDKDVIMYSAKIAELGKAEKFSDWHWHFIGDNCWMLSDLLPHDRTFVTKPMETLEYAFHIWSLRPSAFFVPLHDSLFNRCKSNIAWIESSFTGAATIAPDWEEWTRPGVLTYKTSEDLIANMEAVLHGDIDVEKMAKRSMEFIRENLSLEVINRKRVEILCNLTGMSSRDLGGVQ